MKHDEFMAFAKHFFELGIKASNPLTWEDVRDIIETYHKFTQKKLWAQHKTLADGYQEILKCFEAQKGE